MSKGKPQISFRITAVAVIVLLGIVAFNRTANLHRHYLGGGITITHAHPYDKSTDKSPFKSHSHGAEGPFVIDGMVELGMPELCYETPLLSEIFSGNSEPSAFCVVSEKYGIPGSREPPLTLT